MAEEQNLQSTPPPADDSVDLLQLFAALAVEWRRFLAAACAAFVLFVIVIWSVTPLFEASASLLPQNKEASGDLASIFSGRSPGDVFIGLLSSRTVTDEVVDRVGLLQRYDTKSRESARTRLAANSVFAVGKDTLVTVKVRDKDAGAAMQIANSYLEALEDQREKMLNDSADLHRRFFERQIAQEADALSNAESDLEAVEEKTGLVQPEAQTSAGISAIAGVRGQITSLEVQLASLLLGESEQNPQVKALRAQIAQLQSQEHALESARSGSGAGAGAAAAAARMPELNLDYARKLRVVRYHEALLTSISNQYQTIRLNEGYAGAPYVIVDRAIAPEYKAWPPRKLLALLAFVLSGIFGVVYVASTLLWRRLNAHPAHRLQLAAIRDSFRLHR